MTTYQPDDTLLNFLGGTFHQDIDSPEEALEELLREEDADWLSEVADSAAAFLASDMPDEAKTRLIEDHTTIYFPAMGMSPQDWLRSVVARLRG